jgi:hypothetical protein
VRADLSLEVFHPPFELNDLHVQGGLLAPECSNLLLVPSIFLLLTREVSLDVLFDLEKLVGESLADILGLKGKLALKLRFLDSKLRHVGFVDLELVLDLADEVLRRDYAQKLLPR